LKAQVEKSPDDATKVYELGRTYWNLQVFDQAAKYLGKALEMDPKQKVVSREQALLPLAKSHGLLGEPAKGSQYLVEFMKEFPDSKRFTEALFVYGVMLFEQGKKDEARIAVQKVLDATGEAVPMPVRMSAQRLMAELQ